jgi:8-oxo-dGTP diphosphatase
VSNIPPKLLPYKFRDKGDAWVEGPNGERFRGRYWAAGLLVWRRVLVTLLQHRIAWSHFVGRRAGWVIS